MILRLIVISVLMTVARAAPAAEASFSCAGPDAPIEQIICGEERLADLDRKIAELYQAALGGPEEERQAKIDSQRAWLKLRLEDCAIPNGKALNNVALAQVRLGNNIYCLVEHHYRRLRALQGKGTKTPWWQTTEQGPRLPDDFWGIEISEPGMVARSLVTLFRLADGTLVVPVVWEAQGGDARRKTTYVKLSTGELIDTISDEPDAYQAARDRHGLVMLPSGMNLGRVLRNRQIVAMEGSDASHCRNPFRLVIASGEHRAMVRKPYRPEYKWYGYDCDLSAGEITGHSVALDFTFYPLPDGTFLALQVGNDPDRGDSGILVVRFRPDLTSPFFDKPSRFALLDRKQIETLRGDWKKDPQAATNRFDAAMPAVDLPPLPPVVQKTRAPRKSVQDCGGAPDHHAFVICLDPDLTALVKQVEAAEEAALNAPGAQRGAQIASNSQWRRLLSFDCAPPLPAQYKPEQAIMLLGYGGSCLRTAYQRRLRLLGSGTAWWETAEALPSVPADFWGIELSKPGLRPSLSDVWRQADGSIVLSASWLAPDPSMKSKAMSVVNVSKAGAPVMSDDDAEAMAVSSQQRQRIVGELGLLRLQPFSSFEPDLILRDIGIRVQEAVAGDRWRDLRFETLMLQDGSILAIQSRYYGKDSDSARSLLVLRLKPDLTSPFFDGNAKYRRVQVSAATGKKPEAP